MGRVRLGLAWRTRRWIVGAHPFGKGRGTDGDPSELRVNPQGQLWEAFDGSRKRRPGRRTPKNAGTPTRVRASESQRYESQEGFLARSGLGMTGLGERNHTQRRRVGSRAASKVIRGRRGGGWRGRGGGRGGRRRSRLRGARRCIRARCRCCRRGCRRAC